VKQWKKIVLYIGRSEEILRISSVWNGEEVTGLVPSEWELRIQKAALFIASAIGWMWK
jgi:hypothetical protein